MPPTYVPEYAELYARSAFSFLDAASLPERLVTTASGLGLHAIAIADRDDLGGAPRAAMAGQITDPPLKVIHGATLTLEDGACLPLLVRNARGWANLCRLISDARLHHARGLPRTSVGALSRHADGLIALTGTHDGVVGAALATGDDAKARELLGHLKDIFGLHLAIQVARHGLAWEDRLNRALIALGERYGVMWIPTNDVRYRVADDRRVLDVMTALKHRLTLDEAGPWLLPNHHWHLKSPRQMAAIWRGHEDALARTIALAERCTFTVTDLSPALPAFEDENEVPLLVSKVWAGAKTRYGASLSRAHRQQLEHELRIITTLDLAGYFLIVADIVEMARRSDILVQGRGSAANSAVCYCLGITAIDPIGMDLLFERFLSEGRSDPPDIDLDIAHMDRERVLQYVYSRYGERHASMVCETITWRGKSAVRDVARVLGFDTDVGAKLSMLVGRAEAGEAARRLSEGGARAAGLDPENHRVRMLIDVVGRLDRIPRHRSIHVGGFVLTRGQLDEVVPIEPASMPGRTVIQWDKDDLGPVGLVKIDLLGLGILTLIDKAIHLIREGRGVTVDLAHLPMDDPEVYETISRADTVGLFQIESRAQMNTLPRLRPACFYDLVVQIAIIRPGPIQGQMVHPYIRRKRGEEPVTYLHPDLEPVLARTLGVPLFQEQGMKVAITMAGFTPNQADRLRKIMGFKRANDHLEGIVKDLWEGMRARGVEESVALRILQQLEGFASYGFPESHSASFALLTYASAWLKVHYAPEFTAAILNAQPMGFYSPASLIADAQRHGVEIRPVDLLFSRWECTLEHDVHPPAMRTGLRLIRGLSNAAREKLEAATRDTPLATLDDVVFRTALGERTLITLARSGAFRSMWPGRREALWALLSRLRARGDTLPLRHPEAVTSPLPSMSLLEEVTADYATVGFSHQEHPMAFYRPHLAWDGMVSSRTIRSHPPGARLQIAGLVICRQRPGSAKGVFFMTLEDEHGMVNVAVMPDVFEAHRPLLATASALIVRGILERQQGAVSVLGKGFEALPPLAMASHLTSRNFH